MLTMRVQPLISNLVTIDQSGFIRKIQVVCALNPFVLFMVVPRYVIPTLLINILFQVEAFPTIV